MMKSNRKTLLAFVLFYTLFSGQAVNGDEIFISKHGNDNNECGNKHNKCKTINFAAKKFKQAAIITIDSGHQNDPWIYEVHRTVEIPKNVLIRKNPSSSSKPVLKRAKNSSKKLFHVFSSSESHISNVTIEYIDFNDLLILVSDAKSSETHITLTNTTATFKRATNVNLNGFLKLFPLTKCTIRLHGCVFKAVDTKAIYVEPRPNTYVDISFERSLFQGSSIQFESMDYLVPSTLSQLHIKNVIFSHCNYESPVLIFGILDNMTIEHSIFTENTKQAKSIISVNGKEIDFQNKYGSRFIRLLNVTFTRNDNRDLFQFRNVSSITMKNITIISNKLRKIFLVKNSHNVDITDLEISDSSFTENAITIDNSTDIALSNIQMVDLTYYKLVLLLKSVKKFSLITSRLERIRSHHSKCFHIEKSSAAFCKLHITNSNVEKLFKSEQFSNMTIKEAYIGNSRMNSFWHSHINIIFLLKNITFFEIQRQESSTHQETTNGLIHHSFPEQYKNFHIADLSTINFIKVSSRTAIFIPADNTMIIDVNVKNSNFHSEVLSFPSTKNLTVTNCTFTENSAPELVRTDHQSKNVTFRNFHITNNKVKKNIFFCQWMENLNITNFLVAGNTIHEHAFVFFRVLMQMKHVRIYNNTYQTGVSIFNCRAEISGLTMTGNNGWSSTRELYYSEFYYFRHYEDIPRDQRCWKVSNYTNALVLSNITINTSLDSPNNLDPMLTHHYAVSFVLNLPDVTMTNVNLNLGDHQTAAFEMYVNKRQSKLFKPDLLVNCPAGTSPRVSNDTSKNIAFKYEVICVPCPRDMYSLQRGRIHLKNTTTTQTTGIKSRRIEIINNITALDNKTINVQCLPCSVGGNCQHGKTSSRGNFYGYVESQRFVTYVPCPVGYCCSNLGSSVCKHYKTCMSGREGVLCGSCKQHLQESFFNPTCTPTIRCKEQFEFWFIYLLSVVTIFILVCFLDSFIGFMFSLTTCSNRTTKQSRDQNQSLESSEIASTTIINDVHLEAIDAPENTNDEQNEGINAITRVDDDSSSDGENTSVYTRSTSTENILDSSESNKQDDKTKNKSDVGQNPKKNCNSSYDIKENFFGVDILQSFISFYQLRSLIAVEGFYKNSFTNKISGIFNGEVLFTSNSEYCPYKNLGPVDKAFIQFCLPSIIMLILLAIVSFILLPMLERRKNFNSGKIKRQLEVCYSKILLFNYKNIVYFCFVALYCVTVGGESVLFINGNIQCFRSWQYVPLVAFIIWVLPFPFALYVSFDLYQEHSITYHESMICLTFPLATCWYYHRSYLQTSKQKFYDEEQSSYVNRIFVKPFRAIDRKDSKSTHIFWEHWRLMQRLIFAAISVFVINPLYKVTSMLPCVTLYVIVYFHVNPFKKRFWILHWLEVTSMLSFLIVITFNILKTFLLVFSIVESQEIETFIRVFSYIENVLSPVVVSIILFLTTVLLTGLRRTKSFILRKRQ